MQPLYKFCKEDLKKDNLKHLEAFKKSFAALR